MAALYPLNYDHDSTELIISLEKVLGFLYALNHLFSGSPSHNRYRTLADRVIRLPYYIFKNPPYRQRLADACRKIRILGYGKGPAL